MLIKQKIRINQEKQNLPETINKMGGGADEKANKQKVDSFLENYLWKYLHMIDGKLDLVAEVVADKIQKYIMEEQPESFSI